MNKKYTNEKKDTNKNHTNEQKYTNEIKYTKGQYPNEKYINWYRMKNSLQMSFQQNEMASAPNQIKK